MKLFKKPKPIVRVKYTPEFAEEVIKLFPDPVERERIMALMQEKIEALKLNPYIGTPMFGGPWKLFTNWCMRKWTAFLLRGKGKDSEPRP